MVTTHEGATPARRTTLLRALVVLVLFAIPVIYFLTFRADPRSAGVPGSPVSSDGAIAALEARLAERPDDLLGWQELATLTTRRASASGDPAYYALAERALERADEVEPDAPATLVARANLLLTLHRFAEAEQVANDAVAALPRNATALGALVDAHVELGQYADAERTLQQMLDVDPGLPALSRTSYLRELNGDLAGAVTAMQQAEIAGASLTAERAEVATLLGHLHRQQGDLSTAASAYDRALELVPDHVPATLGRLRVQAVTDGPSGPLTAVQQMVAAVPRLDSVLLQTELAHAAGDTALAAASLELARAAAALQADAGQVVDLELALLEATLGSPQEAVALAEQAHAARPDNVFAADALAWALHRSGRTDEALPLLDTSLRLGTVAPQVRYHAASILAAAGRTEEAADHLQVVADGDAWFDLSLLPQLGDLAGQLDVDAPAAWTTS